MSFFQIYIQALLVILILMTTLWIIYVLIKNVSITDLIGDFGFVFTAGFYFIKTEGSDPIKCIFKNFRNIS